ncbi:MAG: PorV/PorQ family protein [Chitinispirillia bacterium]|jgi:hypothetical protein
MIAFRSVLIFLYIISFVSIPFSNIIDISGQYSIPSRYFPILKLQYDARSVSMGGVKIGMPNNISGSVSNPAALGYMKSNQVMITYKPIMLDVKGGALGYGLPIGIYGNWAVSFLYLSYGVFDNLLDENKNRIEGSLHPYSFEGGISWAKLIGTSLSAGIKLKGMYDMLSEGVDGEINAFSADGFAMDMGIQYRTESSRLIYGLLIQNIGFVRSDFEDEFEMKGLPLNFASGFSYVFRNFPIIRIAMDFEKPVDNYLQYHLGFELNLYKQNIFFRGGLSCNQKDLEEIISLIKNGASQNSYKKSNWSLLNIGTGINPEINDIEINIDFAFNFRVNRLSPGFILSLIIGY